MKIYFDGIIYSWQKSGGVFRYFNELINGLSNSSEIKLILSQPNYEVSFDKVKVFPIFNFFKIFNLTIFNLLRKLLSPINKIFLYLYFSKITEGIFCSTYYTTFKSIKIPQVLIVHDLTHERFPNFFKDAGCKRFIKNKKKCILAADSIICVSNTTKNYLQEIYSVPSEKIKVVYHGVSNNFNANYSLHEANSLRAKYNLKKPFFLFIGHRGLYKNFIFLLNTFANWPKNSEIDLVVVGGGNVNKEEKNLIYKFELIDRVKFIGKVSDEEIKLFYCLTEAFVFPSLDEGFGLPNLEAICCGATVLVSDIPVFKEVLGELPIYFSPNDSASLISAFDKVILKRGKKNIIEVLEKSDFVKNKFSWSRCIQETKKIFEETLNKKNEKLN